MQTIFYQLPGNLHSTESAVLIVYNDQNIRAVGQGHVVAMALLDLSSAFDTVDHATLFSGNERYAVTDQALAWFQSYLIDRNQNICHRFQPAFAIHSIIRCSIVISWELDSWLPSDSTS